MPNLTWSTNAQFGFQNVFRTVTVSYQPYLPFTQAYRMQIEGGQAAMSSQGASSAGYFKMAPEDAPGLGDDERDGYPWVLRRQAYMAEGDGRLAYMSRLMDREERVLQTASQLQGQTQSSIMGQRLSDILNYGSSMGVNAFTSRSSRVASELEIQFLDNLFTQHGITTTNNNINRGAAVGVWGGGQDFDLYLENNDTFKQFLQDEMGAQGMSDEDIGEIHSFELEDRSSEHSKKALGRINAEGLGVTRARQRWASHINTEITRWNARIVTEWNNSQRRAVGTSEDYTAARDDFIGGTSGTEDYEIRQFLNRMARSSEIDRLTALATPRRYVWSNQLGGNYVGFTTFYPARVNGIPQIGWSGLGAGAARYMSVAVIGTPMGRVVEAYTAWAGNNNVMIGTSAEELSAIAAESAVGESVSTFARLQAMGSYVGTTATVNAMGQIEPTVNWAADDVKHLTSTNIALSLAQQIREHFDNPQVKSSFQQWYRDLMEESNELTKAWHSAVGPGPMGGYPLSTEWQFGDDAGNPHKHYLGLWNKEDEDAWKGDLTTGYNFSISPMLVSRRAGTASFGQ